MRAVRLLMLIALALFTAAVNGAVNGAAQSSGQEGTAVITGRVTVNGKPAAGVIVMVSRLETAREDMIRQAFQREMLIKTTTDNEGRYRLTGLQAARYRVAPFAPGFLFVSSANMPGDGHMVTVTDGETLQDIDFALARGGVITGLVTKADGRPLIGERVSCSPVFDQKSPLMKDEDEEDEDEDDEDEDEDGDQVSYRATDFGMNDFKTDDRGIYRIYGLAPGSYVLSVGSTNRPLEAKRRIHSETYHPGVTDKAKATLIEVALGGEVTNANIKLGLAALTYRASGRVIDAETNKPIEKAIVLAGPAREGSGEFSGVGSTGLSNDRGEFRLDGIQPGRYAATATFGFDGQSEYYSDNANFEIKGGDVTGLVIKMRRGLTASGTAIVETTSDATMPAKLAQVDLIAYGAATDSQMPAFSRSKINPDGSFQFRGVRPGKTFIIIRNFMGEQMFQITRVERGGMEQKQALEIAPGEQITDLRIVLAYTNSSIRGQVKIEGGELPQGAHLSVIAVRTNQTGYTAPFGGPDPKHSQVDANGRFEIKGIIAGEYEITVSDDIGFANRNEPSPRRVTQTVMVAPDSETIVTLVLDLSRKEKER